MKLVWLLLYLTVLCCYYIGYRIGVFLKRFVFHILDMLKSKHPPCVKSPGLEYKELPLNSAFLYLVGLGRLRNIKATCKMDRKVSSVSGLISTKQRPDFCPTLRGNSFQSVGYIQLS